MARPKNTPKPEELVEVDWKKAAEALTAPVPATPIQVLGRASTALDDIEKQDFLDQAVIAIFSRNAVTSLLNKAFDLSEELWAMREKRRLGAK